MSEPRVDANTFLLDGEMPRLGDATTPAVTPPAPSAFAPPSSTDAAPATPAAPASEPRPSGSTPMLSLPDASPVLGAPELPAAPTIEHDHTPAAATPTIEHDPSPAAAVPELPTLPTVAPAPRPTDGTATDATTTTTTTGNDGQAAGATSTGETPEHPMAHLMPQKTAPNEASRRAAEIRAEKKAKARKIKIGVAIGALALAAIVGPPLGKWFANAINESGKTSTEIDG